MKIAITISKRLLTRVERQAVKSGVSRSEFFVRAAERLLLAEVTRSYDDAFSSSEALRRKVARAGLLSVKREE